MDELIQCIDSIRELILSAGHRDVATMDRLNRIYTDAVKTVNQRLRKCEQLLRQGFLAEALEECDREPPLLDLVTLLDFPEAAVWCDMVAHQGLPRPPAVLVDIAAELNDAYLKAQSLEELLVRFRLLNLARAPLKNRLAVLWRIREQDPQGAHWEEDVRQFEQARLEEMQSEFRRAVKNKDLNTLEQLEEELIQGTWISEIPEKLVHQISQAASQLRVNQARDELEQLAYQLSDAFSAFDVPRAMSLRQRWDALAHLVQLAPEDPIFQLAMPALQWIDEERKKQQRFEEHRRWVAHLETLLDQGCRSLEHLLQAVRRASSSEWSLPSELQVRLQRHVQSLQLAQSRRRKLFILFVCMVIVLAAVGSFYLIRHQLLAQRAKSEEQILISLIEKNLLDQAEDRLHNLRSENPEIYNLPSIQGIQAELIRLRKKEKQRLESKAHLISQIEQILLGAPSWKSLEHGFSLVEEAEKLCRSDSEKAQILDLKRQLRQQELKLQEQEDEKFEAEVQALIAQGGALEKKNLDELQALLKQAQALRQRPRVSTELKLPGSRLHAFINQLEQQIKLARRIQRQRVAVQNITLGVGNPTQFANALRQYCRQFPDEQQTSDMQELLTYHVSTWESIYLWNQFVKKWNRTDVILMPKQTITLRLIEVKEIQQQVEQAPILQLLLNDTRSRVKYLQVALNRFPQGEPPLVDQILKIWFESPLLKNAYMVQTKDGKRYYLPEEPQIKGNLVFFRYWDSVLLRVDNKRVPLEMINNPRRGNDWDWSAPQVQYRRYAIRTLQEVSSRGWEESFLDLVEAARKSSMDPVLILRLIRDLVDWGTQGSSILADCSSWNQMARQIHDSELDLSVNWIDPENSLGQKQRQQAKQLLSQFPPMGPIRDEVRWQIRKLRAPLAWFQVQWIGWLMFDSRLGWVVHIKNPNAKYQGTLLVLRGHPGEAPQEWVELGTIRGTHVKIRQNPEVVFLSGSPVFLKVPLVSSGETP